VGNVTIAISPVPSLSTDWLYAPSPAPTISGTTDPTLYQTERAGPTFSYTYSGLNPGFYTVTLDFAEIVHTQTPDAGIRIFDVSINGAAVLTNFDIGAEVGPDYALTETFTNIPSSNGQIVVQFTGTTNGTDPNAKVDALSVVPVSSGAPFLGTGNESDSTLFFDQLAQVAWQSYAAISMQARWRFDSNEMAGLTATALLLLDDDNLFNDDSGSLMVTGNRIDGQIPVQRFFYTTEASAALAGTTAAKANTTNIKAQMAVRTQPAAISAATLNAASLTTSFFRLSDFVSLVTVSAVSRAVIASNMITNGNTTAGFGECLILSNSTVQQAFLTIMSNLFGGFISVPARNISDSTLDSFVLSWSFLNTTVT
jgi:hypothetical protein